MSYRGTRYLPSIPLTVSVSPTNREKRFIVLHAYDCLPNSESSQPIFNSLGCPIVSYNFLAQLSKHISKSNKPILL